MHTYTYTYKYMHIYTYAYVHMYTHEYINTYVHTYLHAHVRFAAEDRVQSQIRLCGTFGGESGTGRGIFIRVLPFSQPVLLQHLSITTFLSPNIDAKQSLQSTAS